jgi:hypothetical protein
MSAADLLAAFNGAADPAFTATSATLGYERVKDIEYQRLTFAGHKADGSPFEAKSELLRPETNVNDAATAVAQTLLKSQKPPT